MEGNLSLKSSVLSPNSRRIFDQFNALQQLQSHHRLINSSKAIVDTSAPKSLTKSVVRKDQRKRSGQLSSKTSSRTNSRLSSPSVSKSLEILPNSQSFPKESSSSKSSSKTRSSNVADKISWYLEAIEQSAIPMMPWNTLQELALNYQSPYAKKLSQGPLTPGVSKRHAGCFDSPKKVDFPRPLAYSRVESRLKNMDQCYNAASKKANHRKAANQETQHLERILQAHLRQLEHQETCYEKWLHDQAQRAEVRKEALTSRAGTSSHRPPLAQTAKNFKDTLLRSDDSGRETDRSSQKAHTKREEDKHLEFVAAVTEDILRSGLFSDNAIKHTIKLHLEEKSPQMEESKAQMLVEHLMLELCIDGDHKDIVKSGFRR